MEVTKAEVHRMVCDFCMKPLNEGWAFKHKAFSCFIEDRLAADVLAGEVIACPECTPLVMAKDAKGLADLSIARNTICSESPVLTRVFHARILRNLIPGTPEWIDADTPSDRKPVLTMTCQCGVRLAFSSSRVQDGMLDSICPLCGRGIHFLNISAETVGAA